MAAAQAAPHVPVLLSPVLAALNVRPDGIYLDGTFGRGGHSREILQRLGPDGRLLAVDRDPAAIKAAEALTADPRFDIRRGEIAELKEEITAAFQSPQVSDFHRKRMQDELGDVLFCCVNLARFMGVNASEALHGTNEKFERRFRFIESRALEKGKALASMSLEELDQIWDEAKTHGF